MILYLTDALAEDQWIESRFRWWALLLAESVEEAGASLLIEDELDKFVVRIRVQGIALVLRAIAGKLVLLF